MDREAYFAQYSAQPMTAPTMQPVIHNMAFYMPGHNGVAQSSAQPMAYHQPYAPQQPILPVMPAKGRSTLDPHEITAAIETLYADQLKPYGRILRKRLAERASSNGQGNVDVDIKRLKSGCESCHWLFVQAEEGGDWCALLNGRHTNFIDVYSPQDLYPPELWQSASAYFESLDDSNMVLPGGRYSCAQALVSRGLPFLQGRTLGEVSHIVQLAISQKKILGYLNGAVVPYGRSLSMIKERCAERQKACTNTARGTGSDLADWDIVKKGIKEILDGLSPGTPSIPLSNIKRLFRSRYHVELSETALGHSKLSELLQDQRLQDVCFVRLQGHGYVVSPAGAQTMQPPQQPPLQPPQQPPQQPLQQPPQQPLQSYHAYCPAQLHQLSQPPQHLQQHLPPLQPPPQSQAPPPPMSAAAAGAAIVAAAAAAACGEQPPPQAAHLVDKSSYAFQLSDGCGTVSYGQVDLPLYDPSASQPGHLTSQSRHEAAAYIPGADAAAHSRTGASLRDRARFVAPLSMEDVESTQPTSSHGRMQGALGPFQSSADGMPLMTPTPSGPKSWSKAVSKASDDEQSAWESSCRAMGLLPPSEDPSPGTTSVPNTPQRPPGMPATPESPGFPRWPMLTPNTLDGMGFNVQNTFINVSMPPNTPPAGSATRARSLPKSIRTVDDEASGAPIVKEGQVVPPKGEPQVVARGSPGNRLMSAAAAAASGDKLAPIGARPTHTPKKARGSLAAAVLASGAPHDQTLHTHPAAPGQRIVHLANLV
eukprot:TRINITY_DN94524_c0_g1_i1.p1 TRINITY_DN94524_c0_g1~~TRINITY_DN94524_c0_g1_i1.p1  ORF type:complete len:763 (-),score=140.83 TRINITY_DN94524_c0_g1_i1:164-2452(-)